MAASLSPRQLAALAAVADRLARGRVEWLVAGSAGRALLGYDVRPADLDLEVGPGGADAAARLLGAPLVAASGAGRSSRRGATRIAGVEVDLTCDLAVRGAAAALAPDFALQRAWSHPVRVCGRELRAAPVEETIARALVLADAARLRRVTGEAGAGAAPLRPAYLSLRLSAASSSAAV